MKSYVDKIRELREDHDYTQNEIAKILNCKQATYSRYESNKREIPVEVIIKLCKFYGVSADWLLGLES